VNTAVALKLGRVSNLPTVWTDTLAGLALAGAMPSDRRLPWLLVALSLCYIAGMFLNDAFDRGFDARYRPERPIPSGETTARTVFSAGFAMLVLGIVLLGWVGYAFDHATGFRPVAAGVALASAIVFYDSYHKQNPLSPLVMGLCRMLVYVTAAFALVPDPPAQVYGAGLLLLCYLVGLTYIARQEHLERVANLWPLVFIASPAVWAARAALDDPAVAALALLWLAWVLYSLSFLRRRRPGDVPRAVGGLLAGICLWDAVVIAQAGRPSLALIAVAVIPAFDSGYSRSNCRASDVNSACAAETLTPCFRRPTAPRKWNFRARLTSRSTGDRSSGTYISASLTVGKKNPAGNTPITVRVRPLRLIVLPTMVESPLNTRRHAS